MVPHAPAHRPPPRWARQPLVLLGLLGLCLGVGALGGVITAQSVQTWYPTLAKPAFTPPNAVFAPVWTVLYATLALAAWLVWRAGGFRKRRWLFPLFAFQLAANLAWSGLFFGLQRVDLALIGIAVLDVAAALTVVGFFRVRRAPGFLLLPYLGWLLFATALNYAIWQMN